MLTGHIAIAMAAHGIRKSAPLWLLLIASQLPDWADAVACTAGLRSDVTGMYSHSFFATVLLATLAAIVAFAISRDSRASLLASAMVVAHTLGDYVTGTKPTWPGGPTIGLQLYDHPALDFMFETAILVIGFVLYRWSFPEDQRRSRNILVLPAVLLTIQALSDIVLALTPEIQKC